MLDNDDGIVADYAVECGAAPDGPQLAPAIDRVRRRAGQVPRAVTADRGYCQAAVERDLRAAGVRTVAIPCQATTSAARKAVEHGRGFRKLVKWRTGREGRISYLKRGYGWDRTRLDGDRGQRSGAGTGCSPTTWPRLPPLPADPPPPRIRCVARVAVIHDVNSKSSSTGYLMWPSLLIMDTYGHLFPDAEDLGRGAIDAIFAMPLTEQGRNQESR